MPNELTKYARTVREAPDPQYDYPLADSMSDPRVGLPNVERYYKQRFSMIYPPYPFSATRPDQRIVNDLLNERIYDRLGGPRGRSSSGRPSDDDKAQTAPPDQPIEPTERAADARVDPASVGSYYDSRLSLIYPPYPFKARRPDQRVTNDWLNDRLLERMQESREPGPPVNAPGSDMDMMRIYGPPDQVAIDKDGKPIPLDDVRHPLNQRRQR
jgi:hypothetical protein